ncbi:MAG: hypothetical protein EB145_05655 [Proteobacteria bacterium]|nr:hypothetical protein [Pseudomonadota bacterium]
MGNTPPTEGSTSVVAMRPLGDAPMIRLRGSTSAWRSVCSKRAPPTRRNFGITNRSAMAYTAGIFWVPS